MTRVHALVTAIGVGCVAAAGRPAAAQQRPSFSYEVVINVIVVIASACAGEG